MGNYYLMGTDFQLGKIKKVLEKCSDDDGTTMWMYLMPLDLKTVNMVYIMYIKNNNNINFTSIKNQWKQTEQKSLSYHFIHPTGAGPGAKKGQNCQVHACVKHDQNIEETGLQTQGAPSPKSGQMSWDASKVQNREPRFWAWLSLQFNCWPLGLDLPNLGIKLHPKYAL